MFMGMNYAMQNTLSVLAFYPMKSSSFFEINFFSSLLYNWIYHFNSKKYNVVLGFCIWTLGLGTFIEFISKMNIHV